MQTAKLSRIPACERENTKEHGRPRSNAQRFHDRIWENVVDAHARGAAPIGSFLRIKGVPTDDVEDVVMDNVTTLLDHTFRVLL